MLFVVALIGNSFRGWHWLTLALTPPCGVSFASGGSQGGAAQLLLASLLALCKERGWLKARERQRTDATHMLARIRAINRRMGVGEAMRLVLNSLAVVAPAWLLSQSDASWVERSAHRIEESRLPRSQCERQALAELIGEDGWKVLTAVFDPLAPTQVREIPAIQIVRTIWMQTFCTEDGQVRWREAEDIPPATLFINSPYDPHARPGKKRSTLWSYLSHFGQLFRRNIFYSTKHLARVGNPRFYQHPYQSPRASNSGKLAL